MLKFPKHVAKKVRVSLLRMLGVLYNENRQASCMAYMLWLMYEDKPLQVFVDSAGRVRTDPRIPIKVVYSEEM